MHALASCAHSRYVIISAEPSHCKKRQKPHLTGKSLVFTYEWEYVRQLFNSRSRQLSNIKEGLLWRLGTTNKHRATMMRWSNRKCFAFSSCPFLFKHSLPFLLFLLRALVIAGWLILLSSLSDPPPPLATLSQDCRARGLRAGVSSTWRLLYPAVKWTHLWAKRKDGFTMSQTLQFVYGCFFVHAACLRTHWFLEFYTILEPKWSPVFWVKLAMVSTGSAVKSSLLEKVSGGLLWKP